MDHPLAATLRTARLVLTPLEPADAFDMVDVLGDPALYAFTGGEPPDLERLRARYDAQVAGSPDPGERWHNWIIRMADTGAAIGFVQATVAGERADVAWLTGTAWQGNGFAVEAAGAMCGWLRGAGVRDVTAHIHPGHRASARVATAIGLVPTDVVDDDGERVWVAAAGPASPA